MAWIVNVYSDSRSNAHSVKLLLNASDKSDNLTQYLESLVNKLVVLVENDGRKWISEFDSPLRSQCCASRCCCNILGEVICKGTLINGQV